MLIIVSESLGRSPIVIEVARELSLNLSYFGSVGSLDRLLSGESRRFVVLGEEEINNEVVDALVRAKRHAVFGLIVCADPKTLRASNRARAAKTLAAYPNVEWLARDHDSSMLSAALRKCRRRMLKLGKDELEKALLNREFFLRYQPKVERSDGAEWKTHEAEALIRWRHPENGLLGPLEFLPEAEAFELIGPISEFVLFEAGTQLLRWREQGLDLKVCINLSSSQLNNPLLAHNYQRIVKKLGLECASFTFEVAEQDVASSQAPHLLVLKELRSMGFRISLDDFGVAVASLGTFEQLPFDEIKIHASALKRAQENPVALKVLAAVTGLAHNLGISVCAEGVEDQETFEFLKTIECDKMQGYLISEAVMPEIIRKVYNSSKKSIVSVA
ncbi:MAG: EAL domain-containing protein [Proteobacteria bacterium]|nr:EAL domain-containing protein [Pseudomonadota bacterium]MDA0992304.1 EAL domain-containing protein [Pseudomonadota bacterium]